MVSALKAIAWRRVAFLFPVSLAVVLFLFGARLDLSALSPPLLAVNALLALVSAGFVTAALIIVPWCLRRLWRICLSWITLFILRRAIKAYSSPVQAHSIGEQEGSVVIKLPLGADSGTTLGQRILASNAATGDALGIVQPLEVRKSSCLCMVSDRMDRLEFWEGLENRKRSDFSPPSGVVFSREIPDNFGDFAEKVTLYWRG